MKKILLILGIVIIGTGIVYAAPYVSYVGTLLPVNGDNGNDLGTTTAQFRNLYLGGACIGSGCPTGGSGSGTVSTSSVPTVGNVAYWTSNGYPSLLGSVATGTITCTGTASCGAGSYVIGSNLTITGSGGSGGGTGWASSTDTASIYFTGSNYVGIGTSTPARKLDIDTSDGNSQIKITDRNAAADQHGWGLQSFYGRMSLNSMTDANAGTPRLVIASSTYNVGIGTTSPYGLFSVEQGTETASLWIGNTGSSTPSLMVNGVNGNGNVGIGTASPTAKLQIPNNSWLGATDNAGTGVDNMFIANTSDTLDLGGTLNTGTFQATADSGNIVLFDMPLTSATANGTTTSMALQIAETSIMTIMGTSNGIGNIATSTDGTNKVYVGIGTTTPPSLFSVMNEPVGNGTRATTTVDFGDYATTTSSTCFNINNTAGTASSFYFVGTTMVVEANRCR